jgi:hypothetical protein
MQSDSTGEYTAPPLPLGTYTINVRMQGFKNTTLTNLQLGVDQKLRVDLTLELGAVTESVNGEAAPPVVKSDSSELGDTVTERQIKDLPLNGRNFAVLTLPASSAAFPAPTSTARAAWPGALPRRFRPTANARATITFCWMASTTMKPG